MINWLVWQMYIWLISPPPIKSGAQPLTKTFQWKHAGLTVAKKWQMCAHYRPASGDECENSHMHQFAQQSQRDQRVSHCSFLL